MTHPPTSPLQYGYPLQCPHPSCHDLRFTRLEQLESHLATVHAQPIASVEAMQ